MQAEYILIGLIPSPLLRGVYQRAYVKLDGGHVSKVDSPYKATRMPLRKGRQALAKLLRIGARFQLEKASELVLLGS